MNNEQRGHTSDCECYTPFPICTTNTAVVWSEKKPRYFIKLMMTIHSSFFGIFDFNTLLKVKENGKRCFGTFDLTLL